ncbi:MAG: hypothetical protein K6G70_03105 [Bacteroidaceae bacterium]|nr:hypothetical protein [Bacteroidaceae bacterium]
MSLTKVSLLSFLLSCLPCVAWAAEVSDSLQLAYTLGKATTYTYNYPSKNAAGEDVVLSSSLVAWTPEQPLKTDSIEALHIYSHFTITADEECPSSALNVKERSLFSLLLKDKYGLGLNPAQNFIGRSIIIAPDYEGYGASRNVPHPYLAQELTARQVLDAVDYGLKLYQKHVNDQRALPFKSDWRSFGFGYSQGGAVALAVQRSLEEQGLDEQLRYRGTICGDGPYDLIATLRYYLEDDGDSYGQETEHRKGMCTMPMVMPMILKGVLDTHPDMQDYALTDYFSQQFLDTGIMEWLESKNYTVNDIYEMWYQQLQEGLDAGGRHYTPEQMTELFMSPKRNTVWANLDKLFTPAFYDFIINSDKLDPVPAGAGNAYSDMLAAMIDNNLCYGWEPKHRIQFVHSKGDMVVPYANYLSFRENHPDGEGTRYRIDDNDTFDHVDMGTRFCLCLTGTGAYGKYFQWLDEDDSATAISSLASAPVNDGGGKVGAWYTLDGRRIASGNPSSSRLPKGIYIYKGKKLVIK